MNKQKQNRRRFIPARADIRTEDTWDLTTLFTSTQQWKNTLQKTVSAFKKFSKYENTIVPRHTISAKNAAKKSQKQFTAFTPNKNHLLAVFKEYYRLSETLSRLGAYAALAFNSDITDTTHQELYELFTTAAVSCTTNTVFFEQELLNIDKNVLKALSKDKLFADYKQKIKEILPRIPHKLSDTEEKLLALQRSYSNGFSKSFGALVDADMNFGTVQTPEGEMPISHATISLLLQHKTRTVRKEAYTKYYSVFASHLQTLSTLYASSVRQDNAHAKIRKYKNALEASLHGDNIPVSLYTMLIRTVRENIRHVHAHHRALKKLTGLKNFALYDRRYCPVSHTTQTPYPNAARILERALAPLGKRYVDTLMRGILKNRWVDKYESKGKSSGAFSYPVYKHPPYILMNYKENNIRDLFTLAHEGGHSMHSYLSSENNSFAHFHYSIFCAEIASTLNEYLLYKYLIDNASSTKEKKYYLWHKTSDFAATFFRQTMFAEFEYTAHTKADEGVPLTARFFTELYEQLLKDYTGKDVIIPAESAIEGLRIPHFYRSYYVYQYATGIAAATALGRRVYEEYKHNSSGAPGHATEKYLQFLRCGGSDFPLNTLKKAGVTFDTNEVMHSAMNDFAQDVRTMSAL